MKPLPQNYDHKTSEKKWQEYWEENQVYSWKDDQPRDETFVIDTPPPTVSGVLHMGHIFSYAQADFVARYQRMIGKDVFYPMGFDDNGLPTERLVEKVKKVRATDMSREDFIKLCEDVSTDARKEFRHLFESVALSVDWKQEYHTISAESRKISQLSFLDLFNKEKVYRKLQPMLWDPVDQTAIAQAEVEDKELPSSMNYITFGVEDSSLRGGEADVAIHEGESQERKMDCHAALAMTITIATTRPELLGACVAVFYHPDDKRYNGTDVANGGQDLRNKNAVTALFGVKVPLLADENVKIEKGTGLVMCCTFGDETDILWWRMHNLPMRVILNKYGKIDFSELASSDGKILVFAYNAAISEGVSENIEDLEQPGIAVIMSDDCVCFAKFIEVFQKIKNKKVSNPDPKSPGAREIIINLLRENNLLIKQEPITHAVKCAERSGAALEILPTHQWFIKILDQKEELKAKAAECNWHPDYMRIRINQWIDGLSWDWCISRQRYFGVPFPVWYSKRAGEEGKIILPDAADLPVNPLVDLPKGYSRDEVIAEADVMDTWATSSISPQLSSKGINSEGNKGVREDGSKSSLSLTPSSLNPFILDANRHSKLFPADLRPQAHEIIRTWAFYTIVKAHLHEDKIPWKNLMISGWCLASDKTKMSKSKGNVITPVDLIEEKGADVVRFWASTSRLGCDTAFSEDVLKIGRKLVTKLWNATKFAAIHLDKIQQKPLTAIEDVKNGVITEPLDLWILTRLKKAIDKATQEFDKFEYCDARVAAEDFFWNDFCDNYLELVKGRVYGEEGLGARDLGLDKDFPAPSTQHLVPQLSAVYTIYHCLDGILRLFAPIVPHVTDELYTHIFDDKVKAGGSIHARGNWPLSKDYPENTDAENAGITAVAVLNAVRKLKAERNVSIKWPLNFISITGDNASTQLENFATDLKNVTSATEIVFVNKQFEEGQGLATKTEDGKFEVTVEFARQSSNSDAA